MLLCRRCADTRWYIGRYPPQTFPERLIICEYQINLLVQPQPVIHPHTKTAPKRPLLTHYKPASGHSRVAGGVLSIALFLLHWIRYLVHCMREHHHSHRQDHHDNHHNDHYYYHPSTWMDSSYCYYRRYYRPSIWMDSSCCPYPSQRPGAQAVSWPSQ